MFRRRQTIGVGTSRSHVRGTCHWGGRPAGAISEGYRQRLCRGDGHSKRVRGKAMHSLEDRPHEGLPAHGRQDRRCRVANHLPGIRTGRPFFLALPIELLGVCWVLVASPPPLACDQSWPGRIRRLRNSVQRI